MSNTGLHALLRHRPKPLGKINLIPRRPERLAAPGRSEDGELQGSGAMQTVVGRPQLGGVTRSRLRFKVGIKSFRPPFQRAGFSPSRYL